MEQSPSWEADQSLQLVKKFPAFVWNPKVLYHTHKCPPPIPILSHLHSPRSSPTSWRSILILSSHLRLGLPNGFFPSGFPTETLCTTLCSPIRATCPVHLIILDLTTRTILGKEYRSFCSSLCNSFEHNNIFVAPNIMVSCQHPSVGRWWAHSWFVSESQQFGQDFS
jgi:hypothetical protein